MTWTVVWEPTALDAATRFLADDPASVDSLLTATDGLVVDPRPAASHPWGTDHRRFGSGPWRMLCRLDDGGQAVVIEHVGRVST